MISYFRKSLTRKLLLIMEGISIIPIIIIIIYSYNYFRNTSIQTNSTVQRLLNQKICEQLEKNFFQMATQIEGWAKEETLGLAIEYNNQAEANNYLSSLLTTNSGYFTSLLVCKNDGKVFSVNKYEDKENLFFKLLNEPFPDFEEINNDKNKFYLSPLKEYSIENNLFQTVFLSMPLVNFLGEVKGTIIGVVNWKNIEKILADGVLDFEDVSFRSSVLQLIDLRTNLLMTSKSSNNVKAIKYDWNQLAGFTRNQGWFEIKNKLSFNNNSLGFVSLVSAKDFLYSSTRMLQITFLILLIIIFLIIAISIITAREITSGLKKIIAMLKEIAKGEGDLTKAIVVNNIDEIGEISQWFNIFIEQLRKIILELVNITTGVVKNAESLTKSSMHLNKSSQSQARLIDDNNVAICEFSQATKQIEKATKEGQEIAENASEIIGNSSIDINNVINSIDIFSMSLATLEQETNELININQQIKGSMGFIVGISEQINLLALNATVEAAHAGRYGKGFAVVADEIRKLSIKTKRTTGQINSLLNAILRQTENIFNLIKNCDAEVKKGVSSSKKAEVALENILRKTQQVSERINNITITMKEQTIASEAITDSSEKISDFAKNVSTQSNNVMNMVKDSDSLAENLKKIITKFGV